MKTRTGFATAMSVLALFAWLALPATAAETITLTDEGGASAGSADGTTPPSEDPSVNDSYVFKDSNMRGRFAEKLYVERDFATEGGAPVTAVAMIRFHDLVERIGEGRKIIKAKLVLECTNSSGPKPIEAIAYPFIQDWDYNRLDWTLRMHDGKVRMWNAEPNTHLNLTPAPTTVDDVNIYDFTERHGDTVVMAYGMRPDSDITTIAESMPAEFNVTEIVKLWYASSLPNYGWAIVAPNAGTYMRFWATNGEGPAPKLVIEVE